MTHSIKILILMVNLVFVRLALADQHKTNEQEANGLLVDGQPQNHASSPNEGAAILDNLNSLEFSQPLDKETEHIGQHTPKVKHETSKLVNGTRRGPKLASTKRGEAGVLPKLIVQLIGELEKIDLSRVFSQSLVQLARSNDLFTNGNDLISSLLMGGGQRRAWRRMLNPNSTSGRSANGTQSTDGKPVGGKRDAAALIGDSGNFLSITKQLVRLARSSSLGADSSGWLAAAPLALGSALMSHQHHEPLGHDFGGAALRSPDLFWVVVPAVIVIGTGVIVVPLIAAWLVSHMMSQNTLTVSAGRRRRRRDLSDQQDGHLSKLLQVHSMIEDPSLLVQQIGKFHQILESVVKQIGDQSSLTR